jgi:hypothetical protein
MLIPNGNLVAIAYKTGYCGSLIYSLAGVSPEVQTFGSTVTFEFNDGTAHENEEKWIPALHDYTGSIGLSKDSWDSYLTSDIKKALKKEKLILFRCHPNTAYKLSFIENLKVLYLTHSNRYIPERWAYEKVYKEQGDQLFKSDSQRMLKSNKIEKINNILRRDLLNKNLNHETFSYHDCGQVLKIPPHEVKIDKILNKNYDSYLGMCKYLNITPVPEIQFASIIDTYNNKQWKRF